MKKIIKYIIVFALLLGYVPKQHVHANDNYEMKYDDHVDITGKTVEILDAGIPIMAHLGLTPQSINKFGTYGVRAKDEAEAAKLLADAKMLADAGCFALVLEKIPATLAQEVAKSIDIPVIGIGAGVNVDGQVLVYADMLGMTADFKPKFLRRYADLHTIITDAVGSYVSDVKACDFPNENEQY